MKTVSMKPVVQKPYTLIIYISIYYCNKRVFYQKEKECRCQMWQMDYKSQEQPLYSVGDCPVFVLKKRLNEAWSGKPRWLVISWMVIWR